jgi:hypothetical protein
MAEQSLQDTFPEVWQRFRTWRILHGIAWGAFAAISAFCIVSGVAFHLPFAWWPDGIFIMGSLVFVAFTYGNLRYMRCPRCHKDFLFLLHFYPIFLREGCYHCGLRIYTDDDAQT